MEPLTDEGAQARPRFWGRIAPALLLVILSPVIAEFLLGDFAVRQLYLLVILLPLYGGGALLIREVTRHTGRGWPTMALLAVAYGVFEEGVTTMSLFNPDYAGKHLLSYGFVGPLGTSFVWDVYVIAIHVVFSISAPILIAEGLAGRRRTEPWLRAPGLVVAALLFAVGALVNTGFQVGVSHFVASPAQLVTVAALMVALVVVAFAAFRRQDPRPAEPGSWLPWLAFPAVLALLSALIEVHLVLPARGVAAPWVVTLMVLLLAAVGGLVVAGSRRPGWVPMGCLAVASAAVGTYSWHGLVTFAGGRTNLGAQVEPVDVAGQVVLILVLFGVIGLGVVRQRPRRVRAVTAAPPQEASAG